MAIPDTAFDRERDGNWGGAGFAPAFWMEPLDGISADDNSDAGGGRITGGGGREAGESARHRGRRGVEPGAGFTLSLPNTGAGSTGSPPNAGAGSTWSPPNR